MERIYGTNRFADIKREDFRNADPRIAGIKHQIRCAQRLIDDPFTQEFTRGLLVDYVHNLRAKIVIPQFWTASPGAASVQLATS